MNDNMRNNSANMEPSRMELGLVAVIAYDGLSLFEYGCAVEVFGLPRPEMGEHWYRFVACAAEPGVLRGAGGSPADEYLLLADFDSYCQAHRRALETYAGRKRWNQMSLINIARSGIFAADRSIRDYSDRIWHCRPVK